MAFIRAFTLSRMLEIKTGVNSLSLLCLWKMVVLVGILMLNWLPLIGGEPGVQIIQLIVQPLWFTTDTTFLGSSLRDYPL